MLDGVGVAWDIPKVAMSPAVRIRSAIAVSGAVFGHNVHKITPADLPRLWISISSRRIRISDFLLQFRGSLVSVSNASIYASVSSKFE
jgi:hypothetical protein